MRLPPCDFSEKQNTSDELEQPIEAALLTHTYQCLVPGAVSVSGGSAGDIAQMQDALKGACAVDWPNYGIITIVIDEKPHVIAVSPADEADKDAAELADCIPAALKNLEFPCLSGLTVCPEHVIVK